MKKLMTLMLGMSLMLGTAVVFAQDKPADDKKTEKGKKKGGKKKDAKDKDKMEKKS